MATITSTQAGDWDQTSTWVGGVVPGDGDVAIIVHEVTVTGSVTVGTSGVEDTVAISIDSGGKLNIGDGVAPTQFFCRGDLDINATTDGALTVRGNLWFDDSAAGGSYSYKLITPRQTDVIERTTPALKVRGTSDNGVLIAATNTNCRIANDGTSYVGLIDAEYCHFAKVGTASEDAIYAYMRYDCKVRMINCSWHGCGRVYIVSNESDGHIEIENSEFRFPLNARSLQIAFAGASGGTRILRHCVMEGQARINSAANVTFDQCYMETLVMSQAPSVSIASFDSNFIASPEQIPAQSSGKCTNSYIYKSDPSTINPHYYSCPHPLDYEVIGNIFEFSGNDPQGDCINGFAPDAPHSLTIENNIILPNADGNHSGTLHPHQGNANATTKIQNNTFIIGGDAGGIPTGETYIGHTGQVAYIRNNIGWDNTVRNYATAYLYPPSPTDMVAASDLDYNCFTTTLTGTNGVGMNGYIFSSGTPGANNVNEDPQFVDPDRDLAKWSAEVLGNTGTDQEKREAAVEQIKLMNQPYDLKYDANATTANLVAYVRAGFAPQNQNLKGAGHDGRDIGAVAVATPLKNSRVCLGVGVGLGL